MLQMNYNETRNGDLISRVTSKTSSIHEIDLFIKTFWFCIIFCMIQDALLYWAYQGISIINIIQHIFALHSKIISTEISTPFTKLTLNIINELVSFY